MVYIIVGIPVVLLLAIGAVHLSRRMGKPRQDEQHYFNCPHCTQRTLYRAGQAGNPGTCRRCRKGFTFPLPGSKAAKR